MASNWNPAKTVNDVQRLLDQIVKRHPDTQEIASEITSLLGVLGAAGTKKSLQKRKGEGVEYRIDKVGKRAMLYEVRPAGAPLRVSHDLFVILISVLAESKKPMSYDEIAEGMGKATEIKLADWQGRLLLRFIQRADPPIVVRERSRYRVVDSGKFMAAAQKLWRSTEQT